MSKVRILEVSEYVSRTRDIQVGDVLEIIGESTSDEFPSRPAIMVNGKNGKPIVFYLHEIERVN